MILATHALTGAALGKNLSDPYLIILFSLIIHFLMDSFRHGEYFDSRVATVRDTAWKVILDLSFAGLIILIFIFFQRPSSNITFNILLGSFFSMFPDLLTILYWQFKWKILGQIKKFHAFAHRYSRFPQFSKERQWTLRNALNDILFGGLALLFLFL